MSEEVCESGVEEAEVIGEQSPAEEYSNESSEYDNENSKDIREEEYQERHSNNEQVEPKAKSRLEKKLGKLKAVSKEQDIEELYNGGNIEEFIQDRELTEEEKESLIEHLKGEFKEAGYFSTHRLVGLDGYIKAWKSQDKATFIDGLKGFWYFLKGFGDVEAEGDRNVYDKIANMKHSPILYLSGAWEYPMNIGEMEKISGYELAHIKERKDIDKINEIIEYTIKATGEKPVLMAFSDGAKSAQKYIEKYGMDKISMVYAIAASKFDVEESDKVKFIDMKKDRLFIIEKDAFKKTDSDVFAVPGGHTSACYDPVTVQQIFKIIEETARVERSKFETFKKVA